MPPDENFTSSNSTRSARNEIAGRVFLFAFLYSVAADFNLAATAADSDRVIRQAAQAVQSGNAVQVARRRRSGRAPIKWLQ